VKTSNAIELLSLAALWGASFLFMRVGAPELGPVPLIALRVAIAALALAPFALARGARAHLRGRAGPIVVVGLLNSAVPFCLIAYATLSITSGMAAILNATSPLAGAIVARLWLHDRLGPTRVLGLVLGVAGIVVLVWGRASLAPGGAGIAIAASLAATVSYGVAASYTKRRVSGVDPLAVAAGSQLAAAVLLAPAALALWPAHAVSDRAWLAVALLGVFCTAVAYVLYFRLIASIGPARAIAVTFLVPPFAVLWGAAILGETLTPRMLTGAGIVLAGTALATGLIQPRGRARRAGSPAGAENATGGSAQVR
jgi:drug/metabolite transporter (DMT)-like permease